jgi:site-specific DNA-methyltransferase (adenine-specific)
VKATLLYGHVLDRLAELDSDSVDSIVTDPPYELGFMGKAWDSTGIAYSVPMWRECLRVLKPGGHLLAFGGSRTYHRVACAIEDAGFEVRDQMQWIYGSGFPKSLDVSKAIDKRLGAQREITKEASAPYFRGKNIDWDGRSSPDRERRDVPITAAAAAAAGWGTALKPAHEPICMARKPFLGTVAQNVQRWGTGALNIDGCRIEGDKPGHGPRPDIRGGNYRPGESSSERRYTESGSTNFAATPGPRGGDPLGRWPANVLHDGSDEVVQLFPEDAGAQAPVTVRNGDKFRSVFGEFAGNVDEAGSTFQGDSGSAARFFYCPKADREERNRGCEHLGKKPMNWSSGVQSPGTFQAEGTDRTSENYWPTVKPVELMRYLCRLVTPPGGTVLDILMGSGSTGIAALLENFDFIGIDNDPGAVTIAGCRIGAVEPLLNTVEVFQPEVRVPKSSV